MTYERMMGYSEIQGIKATVKRQNKIIRVSCMAIVAFTVLGVCLWVGV